MTRPSSVRAQAREIYRDLMEAEEAAQASSPRDDRRHAGGAKNETILTKRVRALYEQKAVPVREIAAMAGVSERTIYKYVAKHGWKRRYLVMPRGWASSVVRDRGPRVKSPRVAAPGKGQSRGQSRAGIKRRARAQLLAPIKGAGGRFIRREDRDKPIAVGLKATDPAGASRAVASSRKAARLATEALASAEVTRCSDASLRALTFAVGALEKHVNYRTKRGITGNRPRGVDLLDDALLLTSEVAREALEAAAKESDAAFQAWMALPKEL